MSNASLWAIGLTALFGAAITGLCAAMAADGLPNGALPIYGLSVFFSLVAMACFVRSSQPIVLRIIGGAVFAVYVAYMVDEFNGDGFWRAFSGFISIGVPAGYLAILGGHPRWGAYGEAIHAVKSSAGFADESSNSSNPQKSDGDCQRSPDNENRLDDFIDKAQRVSLEVALYLFGPLFACGALYEAMRWRPTPGNYGHVFIGGPLGLIFVGCSVFFTALAIKGENQHFLLSLRWMLLLHVLSIALAASAVMVWSSG